MPAAADSSPVLTAAPAGPAPSVVVETPVATEPPAPQQSTAEPESAPDVFEPPREDFPEVAGEATVEAAHALPEQEPSSTPALSGDDVVEHAAEREAPPPVAAVDLPPDLVQIETRHAQTPPDDSGSGPESLPRGRRRPAQTAIEGETASMVQIETKR